MMWHLLFLIFCNAIIKNVLLCKKKCMMASSIFLKVFLILWSWTRSLETLIASSSLSIFSSSVLLYPHCSMALQNSSRFLTPLSSTSLNSATYARSVILFCSHVALIIAYLRHLTIRTIISEHFMFSYATSLLWGLQKQEFHYCYP